MPTSVRTRRRCILVVGMHRSGTSAVTRTLSEMGAAIHGRLLEPQPDNPEGFWEPAEIVAVHNRFLAAIGSRWDDPRAFPPGVFETPAALKCRAELLAVLKRDFAGASLFVIKDPRLCRLMPIWLPLLEEFGARPFIATPFRNPSDVALSLAKRNGLSRQQGLVLWLVHTLSAERETRGLPRIFVSYEGFLTDPESSARELAARMQIFDSDELTAGLARISSHWSPALRHHAVGDEALGNDPAAPVWVRETYRWLSEAAGGEEPAGARLDDIAGRMLEAQQLYDHLIGLALPAPPPRPNLLSRLMRRLAG